jgi:hypothetical protein
VEIQIHLSDTFSIKRGKYMLTYSEWKNAERNGTVQYVSEPYLRFRKWHVMVYNMSMFCGEFEIDDESEGIKIYLKEMQTEHKQKVTKPTLNAS